MSLMCMPWVFINMGGEMLYVLEQRLRAQQVAQHKTACVLRAITSAMFDCAFLEGRLFVPQDTWSLVGTKRIFERLAHSSIMRLSDARCAPRTPAAQRRRTSCFTPGACRRRYAPRGAAQS